MALRLESGDGMPIEVDFSTVMRALLEKQTSDQLAKLIKEVADPNLVGELVSDLSRLLEEDTYGESSILLRACSTYKVTGMETELDVKRFLLDFSGLKSAIPVLRIPHGSRFRDCFTSNTRGLFAATFSFLLARPQRGLGEEYTANVSMNLQKIWKLLGQNDGERPRILRLKNKGENSQLVLYCKVFHPKLRPDNLVVINKRVVMFGEERDISSKFEEASSLLMSKISCLPPAVYGKLKFLICYAAAGTLVRFYMIRFRKGRPQPSPDWALTEVLDLELEADRVTLVLLYAKLYFLLHGMAESTRAIIPGYQLERNFKHGYSEVQLNFQGAVKSIPSWDSYSLEFGVSISAVAKAYNAAKRTPHLIGAVGVPTVLAGYASTSTSSDSSPHASPVFLSTLPVSPKTSPVLPVSPIASPSAGKSDGSKRSRSPSSEHSKVSKRQRVSVYSVKTEPLLGTYTPCGEDDLRKLAREILHAVQALHEEGVVHRDIRFENVMYNWEEELFVLIDLESVAEAGSAAPRGRFICWDRHVFSEQGTFDKSSDVYLVGKMLAEFSFQKSPECEAFITKVLAKQTCMTDLLADPWLLDAASASASIS